VLHRLLIPGFIAPLCCAWPALAHANTLPTGFADQFVAGYLQLPTGFDFLPDGRVLVTEKDLGNVRLVVNGSIVATPILTVPDVNPDAYERGLLGIAVDPGWPLRPYVYLAFTRTPGNVSYLSRFTATGNLNNPSSTNLSLGSRYDILVDLLDLNTYHKAGTLRFGPDGMLYLSVGDDGYPCDAQDSTDYRGSILRLNVAALPNTGTGPPPKSLITPPDNPFPPTDPEAGLVFCFGLRNPFRFQIDPQSGRLFIGDVGEDLFEELDVASGGENFGWPFREGPNIRTWPMCEEPGGAGSQSYTSYIAGYGRVGEYVTIIAGPQYWRVSEGPYSFPPQYHGAVFYADYYADFVRVIRQIGDDWVPLSPQPGQPNATDWAIMEEVAIVDWRVGTDGALYYLTLYPGSIGRIVYTGGAVTGVEDVPISKSGVLRLRPNPYRAGQAMQLDIALGDDARIEILSLDGRLIRAIDLGGTGTVTWDGKDEGGRPTASGVYLLRAQGMQGNKASRFVLLP